MLKTSRKKRYPRHPPSTKPFVQLHAAAPSRGGILSKLQLHNHITNSTTTTMKTVFSNEELVHVWASNTQREGCTGNRSMYFKDGVLYSYGKHFKIGQHVPEHLRHIYGDVVLCSRNYSRSTTRHQNLARVAVRHLKLTYLPDWEDSLNPYDTARLCLGHLKENGPLPTHWAHQGTAKDQAKKALRKNQYNQFVELAWEIQDICNILSPGIEQAELRAKAFFDESNHLHALFAVGLTKQLTGADVALAMGVTPEEYTAFIEKQSKRRPIEEIDGLGSYDAPAELVARITAAREAKEAAEAKAKAEALAKARESLADWLAGGDQGTGLYLLPPHLRLQHEEVVTSHGARVPADQAKQLLEFWRRAVREGKAYEPGSRIGYYTVNTVSPEGVVVGCHTILAGQINEFVQRTGW